MLFLAITIWFLVLKQKEEWSICVCFHVYVYRKESFLSNIALCSDTNLEVWGCSSVDRGLAFSRLKPWDHSLESHKCRILAHACNSSKQDVTAGRSEVQVILWVVLDCVKRVVWASHEEQVSKQSASTAFASSFLQVPVPSSCLDLPGWWTASCHEIKPFFP